MSAMAGSVRAMRWVLGLSTGIDTEGMFTIVRHVGERTRFVKSPVSAWGLRCEPRLARIEIRCKIKYTSCIIHVYNK